MQTYRYERIPAPGSRHIRLVTILPGQLADDICISLELVPFLETRIPDYEALSYVWGPEIFEQVTVQRPTRKVRWPSIYTQRPTSIQVTENLAAALRHLRLADRNRSMWIDAICIDQSNGVEKGHQIAMMGKIYQCASRVVAWLGPEKDDSTHSLDCIGYLGSQLEVDLVKSIMRPAAGCSDPTWADENAVFPFDERDLCSIYHLVRRPWFTRLWIRQEICLANPGAIVQVGSRTVLWSTFRNALFAMSTKSTRMFEFRDRLFLQVQSFRGLIFPHDSGRLTSLREGFGDTDCKEDRDRIYATLAFLSRTYGNSLVITPDYTKSTVEVYKDAVLRHIHGLAGGVSILGQCELPEGGTPEGPTWVPDWSKKWKVQTGLPDRFSTCSKIARVWHVSGSTNQILRVAGVVAETIGDLEPMRLERNSLYREIAAELRRIVLKATVSGRYPTERSLLAAYARTLSAERVAELWWPSRQDYPTVNEIANTLARLRDSSYQYNDEDFPRGSLRADFLSTARPTCVGRALFTGREGSIGLAPVSANPGDKVCALFGCRAPILLRPVSSTEYMVVGECYMDGITRGEALLGPLPATTRAVLSFSEETGGGVHGFVDDLTGSFSVVDPRLASLPANLVRYGEGQQATGGWVDLEPGTLKTHGAQVDARYFNLV